MTDLLAAAVDALGGAQRSGQLAMAEAVRRAFETGEHLVVQAGTGTGKSLAYLVPAIAHAIETNSPVVVSTATIALQRQLVGRDVPQLADALEPLLPRRPTFAILKGRGNYLCQNKVNAEPEGRSGATREWNSQDPGGQEEMFDVGARTALGRQVQRLTRWATDTDTGDRDDLIPGVTDRAWSQVSVSARECVGAARCPHGTTCFAEKARAVAGGVDVVVTNHALLAIDAISDVDVLPEHAVLIVDEAHELVNRVTAVATAELSPTGLGVAARRITRLVEPPLLRRLEDATAALLAVTVDAEPGRIDRLGEELASNLGQLRDSASAARRGIGPSSGDAKVAAVRAEAKTVLDDIVETCSRVLESFEPAIADRTDVVWLAGYESRETTLRVAPLSVAALLRERLFGRATTVLTSATLTVGGAFDAMAGAWGLSNPDGEQRAWRGLDVGSPFDHARSGILYIARRLPPPTATAGAAPEQHDEIAALVTAAGGRTLGLFSSMRAATSAAEAMRERLRTPILCQGDDTTGALVEQFAADPATSLFGTLSLWQGVDVPGPSLSLVLIDRIPFPRPDDPLLTARQRAVSAHGGNGFMAVAASHAALLLAQGAGRLLRRVDDKGVVAILDSRMATARYGDYLRRSLPPFWLTTDRATVLAALTRLAGRTA